MEEMRQSLRKEPDSMEGLKTILSGIARYRQRGGDVFVDVLERCFGPRYEFRD